MTLNETLLLFVKVGTHDRLVPPYQLAAFISLINENLNALLIGDSGVDDNSVSTRFDCRADTFFEEIE